MRDSNSFYSETNLHFFSFFTFRFLGVVDLDGVPFIGTPFFGVPFIEVFTSFEFKFFFRKVLILVSETFALASLMRLTDFHPPRSYALGHTTARFNTVISGLKLREADYSRLTPVQKAKATKALAHNRFDVEAIEVLNKVIAATDPKLIGDATAPLFN